MRCCVGSGLVCCAVGFACVCVGCKAHGPSSYYFCFACGSACMNAGLVLAVVGLVCKKCAPGLAAYTGQAK